MVIDVFPATPAARLGIAQGAVITAVDGKSIASADTLGPALRSRGPGTRIRVTWVDATGTHSGVATLVSGPAV
jgi:putative serine protease PepD